MIFMPVLINGPSSAGVAAVHNMKVQAIKFKPTTNESSLFAPIFMKFYLVTGKEDEI
jgi:hypothetical protein